jgi:hypothetical protein
MLFHIVLCADVTLPFCACCIVTVDSGGSPAVESSAHLTWLASTLNSSTQLRTGNSSGSSSSPRWSPKQQQQQQQPQHRSSSSSSSSKKRVTAQPGQPLSELEARQLELQRLEVFYKVSRAQK